MTMQTWTYRTFNMKYKKTIKDSNAELLGAILVMLGFLAAVIIHHYTKNS